VSGVVRFVVVGDTPRHHSWEWRVWAHKGEIYLRPRHGRQFIKASLHKSGHCHVALENIAAPGAPKPRMFKFRRDDVELAPGLYRLLTIYLPPEATTVEIEELPDDKSTQIPAAAAGDVVEEDLFLSRLGLGASVWPGMGSRNTKLLGRIRLDGESELLVIWRYADDASAETRAKLVVKALDSAVGEGAQYSAISTDDFIASLRVPGGRQLRMIGVGPPRDSNPATFVEIAFIVHGRDDAT
jgi:hypothetical protein